MKPMAIRATRGASPKRGKPASIGPAIAAVISGLLLSACATYQPDPLPDSPDLAASIPELHTTAQELGLPGGQASSFDTSDGLNVIEVATLAVINNPTLKADRLKRGVTHAQVFEAGLLPDPELGLNASHPTSGPDSLNGYGLGLSLPLQSLITRGANQGEASARAQQVDLQVVWREWQVAEKAKLLFVQARNDDRLARIYQTERTLYAGRYGRDRAALARGDITLGVTASDLVSLSDAGTRLRKLRQRQYRSRQKLRALLGLRPGATLKLTGSVDTSLPDKTEVDAAIRALPGRRPDLIALRRGYESQEQAVRKAILAQFPSLRVGVTRGRDTGGVSTVGIGITLDLPLVNGNRGRIAVERATRERLRQEYQARLDAAVAEVDRIRGEALLLDRQLDTVRERIPELRETARRARESMRSGNLDAGTYISLRGQLLAKRAERVAVENALAQARIALETLIGRPIGDAGTAVGK